MIKVTDTTDYCIMLDKLTNVRYAIHVSEIPLLNRYFSDYDHFLYAPDDLIVDGIPFSIDKWGIINFFDHTESLKVRNLRATVMRICR